MAERDTKEVFDLYFASLPSETARKTRGQIDKKEVYRYEQEKKKQIFDLETVDELAGLLIAMGQYSRRTYQLIISHFRAIWEYYNYMDGVHPIRNPWNNPTLFKEICDKLDEYNRPISYETIKEAFKKIDNDYQGLESGFGDYLKCIILLAYNGFADGQEIISMKEDMINFHSRRVSLPRGVTLRLSEECFDLLQRVHELEEVRSLRRGFVAIPYHDSYFKIVTNDKGAATLQDQSLSEIGSRLKRKLSQCVKNRRGVDVKYREVYLLGFYDYICIEAGKDRANEIITSVRSTADNQELSYYAKEYGFQADNISKIKYLLKPFAV